MKKSFLLACLALLLLLVTSYASAAAAVPSTPRALFFVSDGMRPDLMDKYVGQGAMPAYANLINTGVKGLNGLTQAFPPNTGVGWYTLATGTWPAEHGSMNNTFHRTGDSFTWYTSMNSPSLQADSLPQAAERAGKKVALIDWVGGVNFGLQAPTLDYVSFLSKRGVLAYPLNADEQNSANAFGLSYSVAAFAAAAGWTNVPASDPAAPAQQTQLTVTTTYGSQNPTRVYDLYIYDSVNDGTAKYDHAILVRTGAGKDGSQKAVDLAVGDFKYIRLSGADGLIGARAGQTAGFYAKLITLAPDLSTFKLYFTSVERLIAKCSTPACNALPGGGPGEDRLEKYIADNMPGYISADYAPLEAGVIDEDTYVQQGRDLQAAYANAVLNYILGTLQPDTELAFVGYSVTDEFQHQFLGLLAQNDPISGLNPYYDNVKGPAGTRGADHRVAQREAYLKSAYAGADARLALARSLMGTNPTTFAASDHGFSVAWTSVNAGYTLFQAGLESAEQSGNCRPKSNTEMTQACWAGGTAAIYINLQGRDPTGAPVTQANYENVRNQIIAAFQNLKDPDNGNRSPVLKIMKKEELRNVDGSDSLHPSRSGDVVVVLRPPYQFDGAVAGKTFAFSQFFGQHGYMPNLVDPAKGYNLHGVFVAGGNSIRHVTTPMTGVRAIDLAPTIAFLLRIAGPQNARGRILYDVFATPLQTQVGEATIFTLSDFHGQLTPLSEAADNVSVNMAYSIGGAAYLKPWLDLYRKEARDGSFTITGGDSVGASPPISGFFGDKPTIEIENMMGLTYDTLGNHNFDKGQTYLRTELIPLAKFPYLASNIIDPATGLTPSGWVPSAAFSFKGFQVGVVGYTLPELPGLIFPGNLDPFVVTDPVAKVNAAAAGLRARGINAIIAVGHIGADPVSSTQFVPAGPLVDFAKGLKGVNAVVGGHSHILTIGLLDPKNDASVQVSENPNSGLRFTRIRLVVDMGNKTVIYKTADWHKPWDIGMTPDAPIQAKIDALNAQLAPIFNTVVGNSNVAVPRTDACGNTQGRSCESLVGDITTDSMRTTYSTDFAITNSGGLRGDLTCPASDIPGDFCPPSLYPFPPNQFPITRGQVLAVLPFGNIVVTVPVKGNDLLSKYLENGVSLGVGQGRFPQVSGLCFTFDPSLPAGSRVSNVIRQAADGSCTGAPVDLTSASTYTLAINDYMAAGGDGYPDVRSSSTSQAIMDQVLADYTTGHTPLAPVIQHRVHCTGGSCPPGSP